MTTSRPTLARRVLGLVAVPALLVGLAACGDDDDSAGGGDFCDQAESLNETFEQIDDPTSAEFGEVGGNHADALKVARMFHAVHSC